MSTMFQKRHYVAIAKILHIHWLIPEAKDTTEAIADTFSNLFAGDNPLYDYEKFFDAIYGEKGGKPCPSTTDIEAGTPGM